MRKLSEFLLVNNRNAALVAFACTLLPLLNLPGGFIAAIIVGFVTLRKGGRAGAMVLAWVALPAIALLYLRRFGVFDILFLRAIIVWLMASILRKYRSWRLALEVVVLIAVICILLMHLFIPNLEAFWLQYITSYVKEVGQAAQWKLSADEINKIIQGIVPLATGIYAFLILIGTFVQLFVARWWESYVFAPNRLQEEFIRISMGQLFAILLSFALLGILLRWQIVMDIFPVLLIPFMLAGLSLLHYYYAQFKFLLIPLILIYIGLLFLPFLMIPFVALLGYLDAWINFRARSITQKRNG